ncbi:hypothetical protein AN1785.2 [Aspergillus nidulans FGSC A4]|uniref:Terpene cyclase sdgD n=1 Tax=Emericella nidulans (strain FGSC A4 / ATCC 38163 / CBS 112.46 / NRRL 194 / M139) TaxID=227321 RepID=SDGD_EMENI|nr:hypothetical protein [Aspergillus nidulans FGSC A4]A0A1U8QW16.1 RecName: Full=Terpene cyclase sdgD; AltName: Full=Aspernidgulenes biosynthesis cluster protein D [Aspergillus nidulans FGSC A4]EAA63961.1 hypothetical protein AN1785.2 [Aspergillus nidulans FGSC A4]CBF85557.1 TPA: conserved hypothetical protein [Aspergillus nidulans FGSC A4]|eukprot:XP_659389.1 hypothetical protein AN1785.2 [Aspergillus nidulans FGSC A4]
MSHQSTINFIRFTFVILSLLAIYTILIPSIRKGFFQHITECEVTGKLSRSSGADARMIESFTGVPVLDIFVKALVTSFWPVINGENPALSLLGVPAVASMGVSYLLLLLEARRTRSLLSVTWRLAWVGLLQTNFSQAIILPIYCAIAFSSSKKTNGFRPIPHVTISLILCVYTGMALVALPSPAVIPDGLKQVVVAFMVPWALWVFVMVFMASYLFPIEVEKEKSRRTIYIFALVIAATTHLGALLASLLHADLGPADVFLPPLPWYVTRFPSLEEGMASFLQWDYLIASVTLFLWAVAVYLRDCDEHVDWQRFGLEVCAISVIISPAAMAVLLIWRLDEMLSRRGIAKED